MLGQDFRLDRPVAVLGGGLLRGVGVEVFQIRLGVGRDLLVLEIRIDPGDRGLGEDTDWRIDDFEFVLVFRDLPQGFVLPRQMHVADLLDGKGSGGAAGARVGDHDVAQQGSDEVGRLRVAAAARRHRTPGGEHTQLAVARGARIGIDDLDVIFDQVGPVVDALWIVLVDDEHDRRRVRDGVIGQALLPIGCDQSAFAQRVDVTRQRQRNDVGFLISVDDFR